MRKILLSVLASLLFAFCLNAQISKGSILLGGGFTVASSKNENSNYNPNSRTSRVININPSVGLAIKKNMIVGAGPSYSNYYSKDNTDQFQKRHAWGINAFIRKYLELGKNFYLFGEGNINASKGNGEDKSNFGLISKTSGYGLNMGFAPGVSYQVSKRFQVEAGIGNLFYVGYNVSKSEYYNPATKTTSKSFDAGANISGFSPFSLGFRFLILK